MAHVLLIGSDVALLEGLTQSLLAAGHTARIARGLAEAAELSSATPPLALLVEREMAESELHLARPLLASGAALLLYHRAGGTQAFPPALQRAAIADLTLPLERHRLLALVGKLAERARVTGRSGRAAKPGELETEA